MPDENKAGSNLFNRGGASSTAAQAAGDAARQAVERVGATQSEPAQPLTTETASGEGVQQADNEGVTDDEKAALQGATGPNPTPAFGKHDGQDENNQLTDEAQLARIKEGTAAHRTISEADIAAATAGEESDDDSVQYSSPSISNLRLGKFQFEKGVLHVKPEDAERFEKLLAGSSKRTQQAVFKIDRKEGEAVALRFKQQNEGRMNRGGETSASSAPAPTPREDA